MGCKVLVHIDNKNLLYPKEDYDKRVNRWLILMNEYNIEFKHIPGNENKGADAISRARLTIVKHIEEKGIGPTKTIDLYMN